MLKKIFLFISFSILLNSTLFSATYYWIGGSGNWSDASNWSLTSGGTPAASIPSGTDDVIFDNLSFLTSGNQVIVDDSVNIMSMDWSSCLNAPSLVLDTNMFINGNVTLHPSMSILTNSILNRIQFTSPSTFNPSNAFVDCNLSIYMANSNDVIELSSTLNMSDSSTILILKGEFKTNGNEISTGLISIIDADSTSTKTLSLSNSNINLTIGFYAYNLITGNFTLNSGSSTITIGDSNYVNYLNCDGLTFHNVIIDFDKSNDQTIKGNNTYNKLVIEAGSRVIFDSASIQNINDSLVIQGNCLDSIYISSSNINYPVQFNKSSNNDIVSECVLYYGVTAGISSITTYFSTNEGANTNIIFDPSFPVNVAFTVQGPYCFGDTTLFTNTSVPFSGNSNDASYLWYFNDGSGYYLNPPIDSTWISYENDTNAHVFIQNGDFSVTLVSTYKNHCTDTAINTVHINNPSIYLTTSEPDTTICAGETVSFEASSGVAGVLFEYFYNGNSQNTPSINDTIFTTNTLNLNDSISVVAYENGCISTNKPSFSFVVNPIPNYSWISNDLDTTICSFDSVSFTSSAVDTSYQYQFLINNVGVTSYMSIGSYSSNTINDQDSVQVVVKDTLNCMDTSTMIFNVNPLPSTSLIESSGSNVICDGEAITFTASGADLYEFYINGISQTSLSTNNTFISTTLSSGDSVSVKGQSNSGCIKYANEIYSYTVNPLPNVGMTFNSIDTSICSGENVIFNASGASLYEFFINNNSQGSASAFSTFNTTGLNDNDIIYVIGTFSGCSNNSDTAIFEVNISPTTTLICDDIDATICSQTNVNFTASGANLYEFFIDGVSQGAPSNVNTFSTSTLTNNQTVSVSGESNTCIVSQNISFTVLPSPSVSLFSNDPNNSICEGENIVFTAANANQYELFINGASQGAPQNSTIFTPTLPNGNASVFVIGSATNGCIDTSQVISVTVTPLPSVSITSSDIDNIFCAGENITFTANGSTLFQFIIDGIPQGSLSSTNTFSSTSLTNNQTIHAIGSNLGCVGTSNSITNTVNPNPVVILSSNDLNNVFCQDQIVTFTASGATNYEFFVANISQGLPSIIDTLNSSSFGIGSFSVSVTGESNNCYASSSLQVSVNQLPGATLTSSDIDNIICENESVTYTSSGANLYEFFINGISTGSPSPIGSYTTTNLLNGDTISVVTSSVNGCTNSSVYAPITVNSNPNVSITSLPSSLQICQGDSITFTASGGSSYEFFVNNNSQGSPSGNPNFISTNISNGDLVYVNGISSNGCSATSIPVSVITYNYPLVSLINNGDSSLCDFELSNLQATGATNYQFLINGNPTSPLSSVDTLATTLSNGDIISVNGETNGCISNSLSSITFTVYNTPILSSTCSDIDNIICINDSIDFIANGANEYEFSLNGNTIQLSTSNTYYTNTLAQGDSISIIGYNGHCPSSSNHYVFTVNSMNLNLSIAPSNLICENDMANFSASGGDLYEFFVNGISVSSLGAQSTYSSSSLTDLDQVSFTAYSNATNCSQEFNDFIIMNIVPSPIISALSSTTFCDGDSVILTSNSSTGNQWIVDGNEILYANDTSITVYNSGSYSLEVSKGGNGDVFSIGANANGLFGSGDNFNSSFPVSDISSSVFIEISSGYNFMISIDSAGNLYSWGENSSGELGDGTYTNSNSPNIIPGISNVKTIATAKSSTMALTNSGEVYVWGDNSQGQLSTGNNSVINFPFLNTNLIGIDSIAAGKNHYIILKDDSTVWSVGNNDYGQLGIGNLTGINQAQQITSINNITKVGAGEYHSFAINSNGDLFVWGNNSSGQLGLGDLTNRLTPTISTISNITNAQGGASHSLFLNSNKKVFSCGNNNFGQLGLGNTTPFSSPQEIPIEGVDMISTGQNSSLFLRSDHSVFASGNNLDNQISPLNISNIESPTYISNINGIQFIEAGKSSSHFLALESKSCLSAPVIINNLNVNPVLITASGDTLSCTNGVSYQWYFNGSAIPASNSPTFLASGSGNYSVEVTFSNGCSNISNVYFHSMSSYEQITNDSFKIYPNPTQNSIHIESLNPHINIDKIMIIDFSGRIIYENTEQTINQSIDLSKYENGIYNIVLYVNNQAYVFRSIKAY